MSARYGGVKTWLAWTDAEHARMVDMHRSGSTFAEIGLAIGRHPASIHGRMARTDANGNYIGSTANLPWPEPLSQLARRLRAEGKIYAEICAATGKSEGQLRRHFESLAARPETQPGPKGPALRTCLACKGRGKHTVFHSPHAGVRLCLRCRQYAARCFDLDTL